MVKKKKQTEKPMKYLAIFTPYPKLPPRLLTVWLETFHSLKRQPNRTSQIKSPCPLLLRRVAHRHSQKSCFVYAIARSNLIVCAMAMCRTVQKPPLEVFQHRGAFLSLRV